MIVMEKSIWLLLISMWRNRSKGLRVIPSVFFKYAHQERHLFFKERDLVRNRIGKSQGIIFRSVSKSGDIKWFHLRIHIRIQKHTVSYRPAQEKVGQDLGFNPTHQFKPVS